jgi:murein DD-endopeptidase MepM/ murein hydrolase activator NlpD
VTPRQAESRRVADGGLTGFGVIVMLLIASGLLALLSHAPARQRATPKVDKVPAGEVARGERPALAGPAHTAKDDLVELLRRANAVASSSAGGVHASQTAGSDMAGERQWFAPTDGWLTSPFLQRRDHPILRRSRPHRGVDIAAAWGAPIVAPAAGLVVAAGFEPGFGEVVLIDHGYGVVTRYAHCSQILVRAGQIVPRGHPVALVGDSGLATGPHLHYEVLVDGRQVDPARHRWR